MIITRKALSRRAVLRGMGVTLALPMLDAMVPAFSVAAESNPVRRLGIVYVPMGMTMSQWTPASEGALALSPILKPLAPFRDRALVISGLENKPATAQDGGVHARTQTAYMTGVTPRPTEGADLRAGISVDQVAAKVLGQQTQLSSLELGIESPDMAGACGVGYSCAYSSTLSWRAANTPLPMEDNPRAVFERLFGASDSTDARARMDLIQRDRSILDGLTHKLVRMKTRVGSSDGQKLDQYVEAVREAERRIQKAEEQIERPMPVLERPTGVPPTFAEHVKLMFDLLTLAYQTDLTRVSAFLMARELSVRTYPEIGVPDAHHPLSHHSANPEKMAKQAKLNTYMAEMFAYFLEKLQATPDGDGTLLDHSFILYGSGMSNSDQHVLDDVPTVVVAGDLFQVKGGRHVRHPKGTPLTNLQLTMLDKIGVHVERFGNSNGELNLLSL